MEKVKKLYTCSNPAVIKRAKVMLRHIQDSLALFTAKFPWFDAAYVAQFNLQINEADLFPDDIAMLNDRKVLTEDVTNALKGGEAALHNLRLYAKLAYPGDRARQQVFGQSEWRGARNNRKKMFDALSQAHAVASQNPYKADLGNKGFAQTDIDELQTLAEQLEEKKKPQGKATKERNISTADRITLHNTLWKSMKTINNCAQLVFRNSYAHRHLFVLYEKREKKKEKDGAQAPK